MPFVYLQAIILGIVQGIAEFLPVSSSGHIVVFGKLFEKWFGVSLDDGENALLNVALHLGTLGSILVVYRRDLRALLESKLKGEEIAKPEPVPEAPVMDLMEALRLSVEQAAGKKEKTPAKKTERRPTKAAAGSSRKR